MFEKYIVKTYLFEGKIQQLSSYYNNVKTVKEKVRLVKSTTMNYRNSTVPFCNSSIINAVVTVLVRTVNNEN